MKNVVIFSIIALLVLQVCYAQRGEGEQYSQYPRPSGPHPGGDRFGEEHGWVYHRNEGYWYHPQYTWRWHPNYGWKEYNDRREYYNN
ncbi:Hypothetical protein CINCED_3A015033 [Cinara cedri]|uniref:Uncharacterized protein n=1 Tax=Cinara cedri TaxID=506608 RepID=A0A5E4NL25_9HEMI|nr:Hypothetical protein CINCED_3A015033 [Cinara cedri]